MSRLLTHRQAAGFVAKAQGKLFEDEIQSSCAYYNSIGRCLVARNYPATSGPPGRMFPVKAGAPDFTGTLLGRAIAFECKSASEKPASWSWSDRDWHQIEFLIEWEKIGGWSFVLLRCDEIAYLLDGWRLRELNAGRSVELRKHKKDGGLPVCPYIERRTQHTPIWPLFDPPIRP